MIIVSDTSPITNLAAIGRLPLLQQLYEQIIIPTAVYNEMVNAGKPVPGSIEVQMLPWIRTQQVSNIQQVSMIQQSADSIDVGEAEAIALALELTADLLLMDGRRGRAVAANNGLKVTGLLGVLSEAKQQGLIPAVKPELDRLIAEADFRVSSQLYAVVLRSVNE